MTYLYGHKSDEILALQQALARLNLYTGNLDGGFGDKTLKAVKDAQDLYGLPETGVVDDALLLELGIVAPRQSQIPKLSIFTQIGTILSLIDLLKGKTMTSDQIGGLVRAVLIFLAGLAVARGWLDNATALTIVGAIVTLATAAWSIFTNRPAKIVGKS